VIYAANSDVADVAENQPMAKPIILPGTGKSMQAFVQQVGDEINSLVEDTSAFIAGTAKTLAAVPPSPSPSPTVPAAPMAPATTPPPAPGGSTATPTKWEVALKHGCWICVRHGLTGKLQPSSFSQYFLTMRFHPMSADAAITDFEKHVSFVTAYNVVKSINRSQASALLASPDLKDRLYHITRFFEFPIPVRDGKKPPLYLLPGLHLNRTKGDFGKKAYFCGPDVEFYMSPSDATKLIDYIFDKFEFEPTHLRQSRAHAIARLITPFCQGLMGLHAKSPLWIFQANRSRAGKDYCAAITPLVYTGNAYEDAPLDEDDSENKRRITAAIISGHRFMHFANCKHDLDQCKNLEAAVTAKFWTDRVIGTSESIQMSNEIIYSLSYNGNLKLSDDLANRARRIKLHLPKGIPANSRSFTDLHGFVSCESGRRKVIAAIRALVDNWIKGDPTKGVPPMKAGSKVFTSFPEWSRVVGGVMEAAGYPNPCEQDPDDKISTRTTWEDDICTMAEIIGKAEPKVGIETADIVDKYVKKNPVLKATMDEYSSEIAYKHELGQQLKKVAGINLGGGLMVEIHPKSGARTKYIFHPEISVKAKTTPIKEVKPSFLSEEEFEILKRPEPPPTFDPFEL
jgi:hypothetical protein